MQISECRMRREVAAPAAPDGQTSAEMNLSALLCAERRELYTFKILNSTFKIPTFLPRMGLRKNNQS